MLGEVGAISKTIKKDPKPKVRDVLFSKLVNQNDDDDLADDNDW